MTVDTSALTEGITDFINNVFAYVPLGLTIIGIPAAIGVGIAFGGRLVGFVKSALTSGK
jgi:hypothetical protein